MVSTCMRASSTTSCADEVHSGFGETSPGRSSMPAPPEFLGLLDLLANTHHHGLKGNGMEAHRMKSEIRRPCLVSHGPPSRGGGLFVRLACAVPMENQNGEFAASDEGAIKSMVQLLRCVFVGNFRSRFPILTGSSYRQGGLITFPQFPLDVPRHCWLSQDADDAHEVQFHTHCLIRDHTLYGSQDHRIVRAEHTSVKTFWLPPQ